MKVEDILRALWGVYSSPTNAERILGKAELPVYVIIHYLQGRGIMNDSFEWIGEKPGWDLAQWVFEEIIDIPTEPITAPTKLSNVYRTLAEWRDRMKDNFS